MAERGDESQADDGTLSGHSPPPPTPPPAAGDPQPPPPAELLPSADWSELARVVRAFEGAWERGERPTIDAFLPTAGADRDAALVELVHADLECRIKAGEEVRVETYLQHYPALANDGAAVLELIAAEYRLRCRREVDLTLSDYYHRFPHLGPQLPTALGWHRQRRRRRRPFPKR